MPEEIVVSLCDRTGNMVRPWAAGGNYECYAVDLENDDTTERVNDGTIHYVEADVREWTPPERPVRIGFGFPPCTDLAVSGTRWFSEKGLSALAEAIELVAACQETLDGLGCPWVLENPKSTLSTHWREPDYRFDPYEFDGYTGRNERYTKDTWLWTGGGFRMPRTDGVSEHQADDRIHKMPPLGGPKREACGDADGLRPGGVSRTRTARGVRRSREWHRTGDALRRRPATG